MMRYMDLLAILYRLGISGRRVEFTSFYPHEVHTSSKNSVKSLRNC
jgi:hypothetical protein